MAEYVPPPFHAKLIAELRRIFSPTWLAEQRALPPSRRHEVTRWLKAWDEDALEVARMAGDAESFSHHHTGETQELLVFAYDLFLSKPPRSVRERLRRRASFQGARYEVAVASICALTGLGIRWHDQKTSGPEFFAVEPGTEYRIAVEAKSRHRPGVWHTEGNQLASYAADVSRLLRDAQVKETQGCPLIVFIDLKIPDRPDVDGKPAWYSEILDILAPYFAAKPKTAGFSFLVCTNFAWHYAGSQRVTEIPPSTMHGPPAPARPLRYAMGDRLNAVLTNYGAVPESDPST